MAESSSPENPPDDLQFNELGLRVNLEGIQS
jgi:hypothetical protein